MYLLRRVRRSPAVLFLSAVLIARSAAVASIALRSIAVASIALRSMAAPSIAPTSVAVAIALALISGCGGDDGGTGPPNELPSPVTDLTVTESRSTQLLLEWTSVTGDGSESWADSLDLRFARGTDVAWEAMTRVLPAPAPASPGIRQSHWLVGLEGETSYSAEIRIQNADGIWSEPSNRALGRTTDLASLAFRSTDVVTLERNGVLELIVERSGGLLDSASVTVESIPGSALPARDYEGLLQVLTFPPGALADTVALTIVDNQEAVGPRELRLRMSRPFQANLGEPSSTTVVIEEDDPGFDFVLPEYDVVESAPTVTLEVERFGNFSADVTVDFETMDGTATGGTDFAAGTGSLRFAREETRQSIPIEILDDLYVEGPETFLLRLHSPSLPAQLPDAPIPVRLVDDDEIVVELLGPAVLNVDEGGGVLEVSIGRFGDGLSHLPVTVGCRTVFGGDPGSADDADLIALDQVISLDEVDARATVSVTIEEDLLVEGEESFAVELYEPTGGASLGTLARALVHLVDNDRAHLSFVWDGGSFLESSRIEARLFRSGEGLGLIEAQVLPIDYTAAAGSDFHGAAQPVIFANPGDTALISVPLIDDLDVESREALLLRISPTTPGVTASSDYAVYIDDDDSELRIEDAEVEEGAGAAGLLVERSGYTESLVTAECRWTGGTAIDGYDFLFTPRTLVLGPGVESVLLPVEILQDEFIEATERIEFEIFDPVGATIPSDRAARGELRIVDDDRIRLSFEAPLLTFDEGDEFPGVDVIREGSSLFRVAAAVWAEAGEAVLGVDFETFADSVIFEPGERRKPYPLRIIDDGILEDPEDFEIGLLGSYRASVPAEIIDDDGFGVRFQQTGFEFGENDGFAYLRVELWAGGPADEVEVAFRTIDGTARAGEDYNETEGTLTLTRLASQRDIRVRLRSDDVEEPTETFQVELIGVSGGVLTEPTVTTVSIVDE